MISDKTLPNLTELGITGVGLPVEVKDEHGKCIGFVFVLLFDKVDGKFEGIVLDEELPKIDDHTTSVLT
jgi:hypothetical protein